MAPYPVVTDPNDLNAVALFGLQFCYLVGSQFPKSSSEILKDANDFVTVAVPAQVFHRRTNPGFLSSSITVTTHAVNRPKALAFLILD